jgi:hypothetical protein
MSKIILGDMVRIKDRSEWPSPPGYRLANLEGKVISIREQEGFVTIQLVKNSTGVPKDNILTLKLENVHKV